MIKACLNRVATTACNNVLAHTNFYREPLFKKKKLAASSMLHEAKIAYYAFDVIVYCMYTHQTRIAYTKRTH